MRYSNGRQILFNTQPSVSRQLSCSLSGSRRTWLCLMTTTSINLEEANSIADLTIADNRTRLPEQAGPGPGCLIARVLYCTCCLWDPRGLLALPGSPLTLPSLMLISKLSGTDFTSFAPLSGYIYPNFVGRKLKYSVPISQVSRVHCKHMYGLLSPVP